MAELFGAHKWERAYGPVPNEAWMVALAGVPRELIGEGMRRIALSGGAWPPSAPEFRDLCLGRDMDPAVVAARIPLERALPEPPEARAERYRAAELALQECFAIIGARRRHGPIPIPEPDPEEVLAR